MFWSGSHSISRRRRRTISRTAAQRTTVDRILDGARRITWAGNAELSIIAPDPATEGAGPDRIASWRVAPPLGDVRAEVAKALSADAELGPLRLQSVTRSAAGGRRWTSCGRKAGRRRTGRLRQRAGRIAFMHDRHRDYELALSGYAVLRLANDEVVQDLEKAIAKIRDLVCLCRTRAVSEE